ncbi:RhaT Permeases of the drug/metabolite transporter (DMT) superfamily [Rhabdaerophilaceae bacterium]
MLLQERASANRPQRPKNPIMSAFPAPLPDRTLAGIGLMLAAMFAFSINDVMGKWLVATYGVAQILLIRSFAAAVMLAPAMHRVGWRKIVLHDRPFLHIWRAICSTAEVAFFYWAVSYLPLADTVAFYLAGPIFVTLFAIVFLKEHVGWRRWLAILVGFVGVLFAVSPTGEGYGWPVLIPIVGTILFAGLNILTRKLAGTNEIALVTWQVASALAFGLVVAPFRWVTPSLFDFMCLCLLGVVSALAHMGVNRALRFAPAAVVVPYQYTLIVWAVLLGFLFFGDVPRWNVIIGSLIIVAAGLYIFSREQIKAREKAAASD